IGVEDVFGGEVADAATGGTGAGGLQVGQRIVGDERGARDLLADAERGDAGRHQNVVVEQAARRRQAGDAGGPGVVDDDVGLLDVARDDVGGVLFGLRVAGGLEGTDAVGDQVGAADASGRQAVDLADRGAAARVIHRQEAADADVALDRHGGDAVV